MSSRLAIAGRLAWMRSAICLRIVFCSCCLAGSHALFGGRYHGLDVDHVPERVRGAGQHPVFKLLPANGLGVGTDASVKVGERQLLATLRAAVTVLVRNRIGAAAGGAAQNAAEQIAWPVCPVQLVRGQPSGAA